MVAIILLAAWLGAALLFSVVVAPAAFRALPTRTLAGALVGATLPSVFVSGMVVALAAAALGVLEPAGGPRTLAVLCAAGAALCCVVGLYLDHRIDTVRARLSVPMESLASSDPIRQTFGRLHALSVLALGTAMILAVVALVVLARGESLGARGTSTTVDAGANC